jgi:hypothetical protein
MAETGLAITYADLVIDCGLEAGFGATPAGFNLVAVNRAIAEGLRAFYAPSIMLGERTAHAWSFLRPTTTLTTYAPYSTGTVTMTKGSKNVELADGTWPSWVHAGDTLTVNGVSYTVASRTDDDTIVISSAYTGDTTAGLPFTVKHCGDYDLPADCGQVIGPFTHAAGLNYETIQIVGEARIRQLRTNSNDTNRPLYAAIRPKAQVAGAKQLFEVMFWPVPDAAYVLTYRYAVLPTKLSASNPYPYGADQHSHTIRAACLAAVERDILHIEDGPRQKQFARLLADSIAQDRRMSTPDYLGPAGHMSPVVRRRTNGVQVEGPDGVLREWNSRV